MRPLLHLLTFARASGIQARRVFGAVKGAHSRRRTMRHLMSLDDHMLRDMGITRLDLQSVLAGNMLEDPTQVLAERARETRMGERAANRERRAWSGLLAQTDSSPRRAA